MASCKNKPLGRAARVVQAVTSATLEALAQIGYSRLSIEEIAARAGVNKTTVYRRWPNKAILVREALHLNKLEHTHEPDTGSVREDLLSWLREHLAFVTSPLGQGIMRTIMTEGYDSEMAMIARSLKAEHEQLPMRLIERGIARGELPKQVPKRLILGILLGGTMHHVFVSQCTTGAMPVEALVDLVLDGARCWRGISLASHTQKTAAKR